MATERPEPGSSPERREWWRRELLTRYPSREAMANNAAQIITLREDRLQRTLAEVEEADDALVEMERLEMERNALSKSDRPPLTREYPFWKTEGSVSKAQCPTCETEAWYVHDGSDPFLSGSSLREFEGNWITLSCRCAVKEEQWDAVLMAKMDKLIGEMMKEEAAALAKSENKAFPDLEKVDRTVGQMVTALDSAKEPLRDPFYKPPRKPASAVNQDWVYKQVSAVGMVPAGLGCTPEGLSKPDTTEARWNIRDANNRLRVVVYDGYAASHTHQMCNVRVEIRVEIDAHTYRWDTVPGTIYGKMHRAQAEHLVKLILDGAWRDLDLYDFL